MNGVLKMKLKLWTTMLAVGLLAGCQSEAADVTNESSSLKSEEISNESEESTVLTPEEAREQEMIVSLPDVSTKDWNLILVNNWHPIDETLEIPMETVADQKEIDARIVEPYTEWIKAAKEAGHTIFLASSYRSVERQQANYDASIQSYINEGYSREEAIEKTEDYIAVPGGSEHHTGLALDMVDNEWLSTGNGLVPEYDTQESQQWLVNTAADYGFILRFPKNKETETGIQYESWHFRYVGVENAQFIQQHGLALEEYIELLEKAGKTKE